MSDAGFSLDTATRRTGLVLRTGDLADAAAMRDVTEERLARSVAVREGVAVIVS